MSDTGNATSKRESPDITAGCLVFALPLMILLSPLIALLLALEEFRSGQRYRQFMRRHGPAARGLVIYSNSPNWQAYIEREWIPRMRGRLVVLNWSERAQWDKDYRLEAKIFRRLGHREFNPAAIVFRSPSPGRLFRRWRRAVSELDPIGMLVPYESPTDVVRFFQAFRDYKHGREHTLRAAERELWSLLGESEATMP